MLKNYLRFWADMISYAVRGNRLFYGWCALLAFLSIAGVLAYSQQIMHGMIVTNLSDQVGWGAYIANFTYLVGVSDAAVLLVIPAYIYQSKEIKEVVLIGMMLAIAAIIMSLLFIVVDLGRPDHFLHILPGIGRLNFPASVLAWDVVFLNGYLVLSLHIPGYLLYTKYRGETPKKIYYLPFIIINILWAFSVHTVTAFLYSGLGGRPYWNSAVLAPRFLVSSFACGSALLILIFSILKRLFLVDASPKVFNYLRNILLYTLMGNLFLLGAEVFKEFYTDNAHTISAKYLFFGLYGHGKLVPYIWGAVIMEFIALIFILRKKSNLEHMFACAFVVVGIWVEKGMGLIVPGFVPTPLGDIVEYTPSLIETLICLGIWSFGTLIFTLAAKVVVGIMNGKISAPNKGMVH